MDSFFYTDIPTWENNSWTSTSFKDRDSFKDFVLSLFKEPGKYEFDETSFQFNAQARIFNDRGFYCDAPFKSKDFISYWNTEKLKCRKGVIFKKGDKTWYLPRAYYMWVNFLKINDKVKKRFAFPEVWDSHYHLALYELLAELHYLHVALLKKRQIGSSFYHTADLINILWFEEGPVLKMGASLKDYVNEKGSWKFLDEYRNFLDENTGWIRPMNSGKVGMWQQQIEVTQNNRKTKKGLKGVLQMATFEKDPTSGVGGLITRFYHEEAGIAPKMDTTYEYIQPALQSGDITTGLFIAAGSVGDLDQCGPLKSMLLRPRANSIYPVLSNLIDDKGTVAETGLFIPEQWSMPPFIDDFGNSLVEQALAAIKEKRILWKKDLSAGMYQLRISQHPINIHEAFAHRKTSIFPLELIAAQKRRIEDKQYPIQFVELSRDPTGKAQFKLTSKLPISEFPVDRKQEDKTGSVVMYEKPIDNPEFGIYYAGVDPVSTGKTNTSESLFSIYIYKNDTEVTRIVDGEPTTFIEHGKIVATWCGRYNDLDKTNEQAELLIEIYNAWTLVEADASSFINYMIAKKKQRYLVQKSQFLLLKDIGANANTFQEYGWKNSGTLFKEHMLGYGINFLKEELDVERKEDGDIVKITYGIERISDIMLLTEMEQYDGEINVDRLIAFCSLISFVKVQQANRGYRKRVEKIGTDNKSDKDLYKSTKSAFRHMGTNNTPGSSNPYRNPFRNLK